MDSLPSEIVYEILAWLHPRELLMCSQLDGIIRVICFLESLWRTQVGSSCKELFGMDAAYEICKLYCQLMILEERMQLDDTVEQIYAKTNLYLTNKQLTAIPSELSQLTNLQGLNLSSNQLTIISNELIQLTIQDCVRIN